jgi:hypothetical protein
MIPRLLGTLSLLVLVALPAVRGDDPAKPIDLGARRELFVDKYLIDRLDGVSLRLEQPRDEGVAFRFDKPWEGPFSGYCTIIRDGGEFRAYYRGLPSARRDGSTAETTCVALSKDGRTWTKPDLGLFEVNGTKATNVILADLAPFSHNFCPMIDPRPGAPKAARYKALAGTVKTGLHAFTSADGLRWTKTGDGPVIPKGAFDSQNVPTACGASRAPPRRTSPPGPTRC